MGVFLLKNIILKFTPNNNFLTKNFLSVFLSFWLLWSVVHSLLCCGYRCNHWEIPGISTGRISNEDEFFREESPWIHLQNSFYLSFSLWMYHFTYVEDVARICQGKSFSEEGIFHGEGGGGLAPLESTCKLNSINLNNNNNINNRNGDSD